MTACASAEKKDDLRARAVTQVLPHEDCIGCGACVSVCPKDALRLMPDELGYYCPQLSAAGCIDCGQCVKVCPAMELPPKQNLSEPDCYAFIARDRDLLYKSSSGGIFPLLAEQTIRDGGIVVGAAWQKDYTAAHIIAANQKTLEELKKSKYFQSYMGDIDRRIKKELDTGRNVLFTGCPCQAAGLKKYLGKEYENLILVDMLCGNAPSAMFFQKYLKETFPNGVRSYQFRCKKQGWNSNCVEITLPLGRKIVRRGGAQDPYQQAYHSHMMCAPHCEHCRYQALPRYGDITMGDFWGYIKRDSSVDTTKGISAVLCNNDKGRAFFERIPQEKILVRKKVPYTWIAGNGYALPGKHNWTDPGRNTFYRLIPDHSFSESLEAALKVKEVADISPIEGFPPVQYDSYTSHFRYDPAFWEEHVIGGRLTLLSCSEKAQPGKMAVLPFRKNLEKGRTYRFRIRFKANSNAEKINLHVVNAITPKERLQVICSCTGEGGFRSEWVERDLTFVPKNDFYNGFAIGAMQFNGENAYFMLDYISVEEVT